MTKTNHVQATLLAIDTSTPACSVALRHQGQISTKYVQEARKHTQILLPLIDELLTEASIKAADIQGIMIGAGPGAFTGLRVGASMAMGMACANNVEIAPVSSLALLAATTGATHERERVLAMMDARMSEIYAGLYERQNGHWVNIGSDRVCTPENVPPEWLAEDTLIAGSGLVYEDRFTFMTAAQADNAHHWLFDAQAYPLAQYLFEFVESASWQGAYEGVELHYLRNEVTQK